jgi:two-component system chemotaxis response regulator CheV
LTSSGYIVRDFENANSLLEYIEKERPDLIITDLEMPQLNGIQLVSLLKGNTMTNGIPVIIFTSLESEDNKNNAIRAGAIDFIGKSNISNLIESVDKYISGVAI